MEGVGAITSTFNQAANSQGVSVRALVKAKDVMEMQGQAAIKLIESASLGNHVNIKA